MINLEKIQTELQNTNTLAIDNASTLEMLRLINEEDKKVALAVEKTIPQIAAAVDAIYEKLKTGGRLVYCGAGTSGRLGVLDAVECPPTYGVSYDTVVALIAGGDSAFVKAKEGAEDDKELGKEDLKRINFSDRDILVGIAASGRTPYVIGALEYAKSLNCTTISLACVQNSELSKIADINISPVPGPEAITGSTRMKSGTAQKMVLNMLSTAVMIKLGKVYGNLMVDVKATNKKLVERAINIVRSATRVSREEALDTLNKCDFSAKHAILVLLSDVDYEKAKEALAQSDGKISEALKKLKE